MGIVLWCLLLKERICSRRSKSFSYRVDPILKGYAIPGSKHETEIEGYAIPGSKHETKISKVASLCKMAEKHESIPKYSMNKSMLQYDCVKKNQIYPKCRS